MTNWWEQFMGTCQMCGQRGIMQSKRLYVSATLPLSTWETSCVMAVCRECYNKAMNMPYREVQAIMQAKLDDQETRIDRKKLSQIEMGRRMK
jgi:hypothetical protein